MNDTEQTVLITGGAGLIGSSLVRQCLLQGVVRIVNLDKFTYAGHRSSLSEVEGNPNYTLVEGDVTVASLIKEVLAEHRPSALMHLAAESSVDKSIDDPCSFAVTNVLGTCTLLDETLRYWRQLSAPQRERFRFLYVSTDEVFGAAEPEQVFDENSPLSPNSPYAASKAAGEQLTQSFHHTYGLPTLVANPTNHYGPRQHPEKFIPRMILNALSGEQLPIYGDGRQQRDWIYVEDGCRALRSILTCGVPGQRYLVGTEICHENLQIVQSICDLLDESKKDGHERQTLISHVTDRLGHDRRYAVNASKLRKLAAWRPNIDFQEGLRRTIAWYSENLPWVRRMGG